MPKADLGCFKQIRGVETFSPHIEILTVLKPIYGLNGVPLALRTKLHQVLEIWQQGQKLYAEPELYCVHKSQSKWSRDPIGRAQAHSFVQQEVVEPRSIILSIFVSGNLQCLLSVHVGDINCTAPKEVSDSLLRHLNERVGRCKVHCSSFLHIGIQHGHSPGVVFIHQCVYVGSIQPVKPEFYQWKDDAALCGGPFHEAYRSVLGAVAWTVVTRVELAVYVQAFQRRVHAPMVIDRKRFNLLLRHVKKPECGLK